MCSSGQDLNWHGMSRGPPAIAERPANHVPGHLRISWQAVNVIYGSAVTQVKRL